MPSIADVRTELARIGGSISGWRGEPYIGEQINPPVIKVARPAYDPRLVHSAGKARYQFRMIAYWKRGAGDAGEAALDALAPLLVSAVQDDTTNWTTVDVDFAQVTQVGEVSVVQWLDAAEYFALPFDVEVIW